MEDLPELYKLACNINETLAYVENAAIRRAQLGKLFRRAREICRDAGRSFDKWCKEENEFGLSKTRIYQIMNGQSTGNRRKTSTMVDVPQPEPKADPPPSDSDFEALCRIWAQASPASRERFLEWIGPCGPRNPGSHKLS